MTSANLLIIVLIGLVVGAMMGLALHGILDGLYLAVVASFVATVIACAIRNTIMVPGSGAPDESRMPIVVSVFSIVASLAGSAAATEVARHSHHQMSPSIWIGALAGLFSSILMAMLMIVHHLNPDRDANQASLRKGLAMLWRTRELTWRQLPMSSAKMGVPPRHGRKPSRD
jgi:hypothetical protein